jgi:hypothetical protein
MRDVIVKTRNENNSIHHGVGANMTQRLQTAKKQVGYQTMTSRCRGEPERLPRRRRAA